MLVALQNGLRTVLNRPRVFVFIAMTMLLEAVVRLALGVLHPVAAVVCPPVIAVPLLGAGAPTVQAEITGQETSSTWTVSETIGDRGRQLFAVAIGGHLVALVLGGAVFIIVDTPLRMIIYMMGGTISKTTVYVGPLAGVAAGTLLAWGGLVPAVERAATNGGARDAAVVALRTLFDIRRTGVGLGLQAVCVLVGGSVVAVCLAIASQHYPTPDAARHAFLALVGVVTGVVVLLGIFVYPLHIAYATSKTGGERTVPVQRMAFAVILITGLVVGASTVRITETRPSRADTAPASLPEEPTKAYSTALEQTAAADHRIKTVETQSGNQLITTTIVERSSRQIQTTIQQDNQTRVGYADSATTYRFRGYSPGIFSLGMHHVDGDPVYALPGYWQVSDDYTITDGVSMDGLPAAQTGTWTTRETANGTRTIELTGDTAVFNALQGQDLRNVRAETAWIRIRIDNERGVVVGGRARLNASIHDGRLIRNIQYTVETGEHIEAHRPAALGPRSLGEWIWDLFAY